MSVSIATRLQTDRLILRPPQPSDASRIYLLAGDWDIARGTLNIPYPYEESMAQEWIESATQAWEESTGYAFIITLKESDQILGGIGIHPNQRHERAEIGYWLGKVYWGKGYATEAATRIIQFGFEELGMNRMQASYFLHNPASRRVMEKAGMTYEATLRSYCIRENEHMNYHVYEDLGMCAILRSEWESR